MGSCGDGETLSLEMPRNEPGKAQLGTTPGEWGHWPLLGKTPALLLASTGREPLRSVGSSWFRAKSGRAGFVTLVQAPSRPSAPAPLTPPDPALPVGRRTTEPRAAACPKGAGPHVGLGWDGRRLDGFNFTFGDRFSALPELVTLLCSSGERYQKGWVTNLEVLRGTT